MYRVQTLEGWPYTRFKNEYLARTGLDLNRYKDAQMERRIRQFMDRYRLGCFGEFMEALMSRVDVDGAFRSYLTINTSSFFRDGAIFERIETEILPNLLECHRQIKIWSAPCSMGQEPYSIAIILDRMGCLQRATIVATDIDEAALAAAVGGMYHRRALEGVDPAVLRRYFSAGERDQYEICPRVRRAVRFERSNLLKQTERRNHLVLCRNLLIYLKQDAQDDLIGRIVGSLEPRGFLVVGGSENIPEPARWGMERTGHSCYQLA